MASRKAIISQTDVTRILKGAKKAGVELTIVVKDREVHFVQAGEKQPELSALEKWKAQTADRRAHEKQRAAEIAAERDKAMRPEDLAKYWGCSPDHVRNLIKRGELKSSRIGDRLIRIRWEDVEDFQKRHDVGATGDK